MSKVSRFAPSLVALAAVAASATPVSADPICTAPNVMVVLDKSSSMLNRTPSGIRLWDAASMGVGELVTGFEDRIDFGLQIFPAAGGRCTPGEVVVAPGPSTSAAIISNLDTPPPSSGNYTPIYQTLEALEGMSVLRDATRENRVVLITDGWQWCSNADSESQANRFKAVPVIERLFAAGIKTHVIGFGGSVDPLLLNRAAVAGGTARTDCNAASGVGAADNCYTQVDDIDDLRAILNEIATDIGEEICDGIDNNCDGNIDEGFDQDRDGFTTCEGDCNDFSPAVHPGAEEICDTLDNDCDGVVDPGCACTNGQTRACSAGVGVCGGGNQMCVAGAWGNCEGATTPSTEICDGLDNDCDGTNDEGAMCAGEFEICLNGRCTEVDLPDAGPIEVDAGVPGGVAGGAGCAVGGSSSPSSWLLLAGVAYVLTRRRRR